MLNSQKTSGATRMSKLSIAKVAALLRGLSVLGCIATVVWASAALAAGSSLPYGGGGPMAKFDAIIGQYNATGELFRIEGHCQSSCTMFLAIRNVCVDPNANLLFHAALSVSERDHAPYPERNAHMASHYNSSLREFVLANHYMDSFAFHPISGRAIIHKFGYPQCSKK
jgi:hypothetical protein